MADDQAAAYLAAARSEFRVSGAENHTHERLLAALDVALAHHQPRPMREDEILSFLVYAARPLMVCKSCRDDAGHVVQAPCPEVRDITDALLGEEADRG